MRKHWPGAENNCSIPKGFSKANLKTRKKIKNVEAELNGEGNDVE
jgi:hypothetical protein